MRYSAITIATLVRILSDERDLADWYLHEHDDVLRLAA